PDRPLHGFVDFSEDSSVTRIAASILRLVLDQGSPRPAVRWRRRIRRGRREEKREAEYRNHRESPEPSPDRLAPEQPKASGSRADGQAGQRHTDGLAEENQRRDRGEEKEKNQGHSHPRKSPPERKISPQASTAPKYAE